MASELELKIMMGQLPEILCTTQILMVRLSMAEAPIVYVKPIKDVR